MNVLVGQNDGLPNITGVIPAQGSSWNRGFQSSGAFSRNSSGRVDGGDSTGSDWATSFKFTASNGETKTNGSIKTASEHHVYGAANGVQPQNISIRLWKRVN